MKPDKIIFQTTANDDIMRFNHILDSEEKVDFDTIGEYKHRLEKAALAKKIVEQYKQDINYKKEVDLYQERSKIPFIKYVEDYSNRHEKYKESDKLVVRDELSKEYSNLEKVRENRLNLTKELFNFFHKDPETKNLSQDQVKEKVADILSRNLKDTNLIDFFKEKTLHQDSGKSIHLSEEEIRETIRSANGKIGYEQSKSDLPYELWLQTQTTTYKKHFGNSRPNVVYHGTKNQFLQFDDEITKSQGRSNSLNNFGNGHYFTSNKDFANSYADNGNGEVKSVLINGSKFADISDTYISREQEELKKDHSFLLFVSMVNQAIAQDDPKKLQSMETYARSLSFGDRAITDINTLQSLDQSIYKAVGFQGIKWEKMDGKDEIISFSARNVIHTLSPEQIEKVEQSLNTLNPEQAKQDLDVLASTIHTNKEWTELNNKAKTAYEAPKIDILDELSIKAHNNNEQIIHHFDNEDYRNKFAEVLVNGNLTEKYNVSTKELLEHLPEQIYNELNKTLKENHSTNIDELKSMKFNAIPKKELKDNVLNVVAKQEIEKIKREYGVEKDIVEQRSKKLFDLIPIPMWKETVKVGSERVLENEAYKNYVSSLNDFIKSDNGTIDDLKRIGANIHRQKDVEETITKEVAHFQSGKINTFMADYRDSNTARLIKEIEHNIKHSSIYANTFKDKENVIAIDVLKEYQRSKELEQKTRQYDFQETIDGTKRAIEKKDTTVKAVAQDPKIARAIELKMKAEEAKLKLSEKQTQDQKNTQSKKFKI